MKHTRKQIVIKAKELSEKHGWFNARQFYNEANAWIHTQTTGPGRIRKGRIILDGFPSGIIR